MMKYLNGQVTLGCILVSIGCFLTALAYYNGWNPYELAPILHGAQMGLSCAASIAFAILAGMGIVQLVRRSR